MVWAVSAVATILMIACLAMAAASGGVALTAAGIGAAGQAAQGAAAGAAPALMGEMRDQDSLGYIVDSMFRPVGPTRLRAARPGRVKLVPMAWQRSLRRRPPRGEPSLFRLRQLQMRAAGEKKWDASYAWRSMANCPRRTKTYLTQVVAQETGMTQPEAEQRVNQVIEKAKATKAEAEQKAKEAADAARKAGMYTALWGAVAMLAGAFAAAWPRRGAVVHGMLEPRSEKGVDEEIGQTRAHQPHSRDALQELPTGSGAVTFELP